MTILSNSVRAGLATASFSFLIGVSCAGSDVRADEAYSRKIAYTADGRSTTGELRWDAAKKSLTLRDESGQPLHWPKSFSFAEPKPVAPPPEVTETPDRVVAVLGYRERLTGRLRSVESADRLNWSFGTSAESVAAAPSIAFAWAVNPTKTVALFESFERADDRGTIEPAQPAPDGRRVLRLDGMRKADVAPHGGVPFRRVLVQTAFLEQEPAADNGPLTLSLFGDSTEEPMIVVELRSSGDTWEIASPQDARSAVARIPRRPGVHRLGVLYGEDRIRLCIDESVVTTFRDSRLSSIGLTAVSITATVEKPREVDALGVYAYGPAPSLLQRSPDDLLQLHGGHEWLGQVSGMSEGRWQLTEGDTTRSIPLGMTRTWLPKSKQFVGEWLLGPVLSVTFFRQGDTVWETETDDGYFASLGLLEPPGKGQDRVEGVLDSLSDDGLRLRLPQGGILRLPFDRVIRIEPVPASGLRVIDSRLHHLGDEIDLKVIPPDPSGDRLALSFDGTAEAAAWPTVLAVDVVEVLSASSPRFADLIRMGELITEVRLNDTLLGTLNDKVSETNETPERILFDIPDKLLKAGANRLEFRQKGRSNDPTYLDDLGLLGVRLYRKP